MGNRGFSTEGFRDDMRLKIAAATFLCLVLAAFFAVLKAQAAPRHPQAIPPSSSDSRSVWDGVYTDEQAERGHSVYHSQCEVCHGESLMGGDEVPPLAGPQFLSNWNGLTMGDLFERIRKSMPANDPGHLTRQQNADVLAYLLSFNMFPEGKAELPHDAELLKQIRIEATKPDRPNDK
jgi:S-disulfanyl-L-cysteine oxidoreductase SoxD